MPNFLRLRRKQSKARSEIGPIEGHREADPTIPRPIYYCKDSRLVSPFVFRDLFRFCS